MRKPRFEIHYPKNPDKKHFSIAICGRQIAEKGHAVPMRVYPNNNFSFVLNGCGTFHSDFGDFRVTPGNGYFIKGGTCVSYEADELDPWEYIFVNFSGDTCDDFLKLAGISPENPVFSFPMDDETVRILNGMLNASDENASSGYGTLGYFYLLVSRLIPQANGAPEDIAKRRLDDMVRYIEANFERNITVNELSERFFIDRSGIYRIFEHSFGVSPKKYILRFRLAKAAEQLCEGNEGITEIAFNNGFFDHSHFSKSFTEFFGMTPGEYRKAHQK